MEEMKVKMNELRNELFNLRFQLAIGQLDDTHNIREIRKDIARLKHEMNKREI